jgi:hypothetical protein
MAIAAGLFVPGQQIAQPQTAAILAAGHADLIVPRQRKQQKPGVLERNAHRCVQIEISLVGLT